MKEDYLHYIWRLKRLKLHNLFLVDGRKLEVINTGWHNQDAGPDFFNGKIKIDNITWSGNIELHIKSSDWYQHNHHLDSAYDNVVLHVVYEHDKEVVVDGAVVPTLTLSEIIDEKHLEKYGDLISKPIDFPCKENVPDSIFVDEQINTSLFQRLQRKANQLAEFNTSDNRKLFFVSVFQAFGGRVNKLPFIELANTLPYEVLLKESWDQLKVDALIFGCAGFLNNDLNTSYHSELIEEWKALKNKYQLQEMTVSSWKFGGVRPYNFPTFKLAQISAFLKSWQVTININDGAKETINKFKALLDIELNPFWNTHFKFEEESKNKLNTKISDNTKNLIIINGLVPYLVYLSQKNNKYELVDKAFSILENLPPEKNSITKKWSKIGIKAKNAGDSQGLIELKNEFCNFRRCLSCKIGHKILER